MGDNGGMCVLIYTKQFLNLLLQFPGTDMRKFCLSPEWLLTFAKKLRRHLPCFVVLQCVSSVWDLCYRTLFISLTNCLMEFLANSMETTSSETQILGQYLKHRESLATSKWTKLFGQSFGIGCIDVCASFRANCDFRDALLTHSPSWCFYTVIL